jgi:expansin (peptidoglycan-binding protein)
MTTQSGFATYYNPDGHIGACERAVPNDCLGVAVSPTYGKAACGKQIQVNGPQGSVQVTVVDVCPTCEPNHLDLTQEAFSRIAPLEAGNVSITWDWVS